MLEVALEGVRAELQAPDDLGVGESAREQVRDLDLAGRDLQLGGPFRAERVGVDAQHQDLLDAGHASRDRPDRDRGVAPIQLQSGCRDGGERPLLPGQAEIEDRGSRRPVSSSTPAVASISCGRPTSAVT